MEQYEKDHLAVVLNNAAECTVLLKTNGRFPLKSPCRLAAYGAGVRHTVRGGTGSGEVNTRFSYTIEEGLENAGFTITTKTWLDAYDAIRTNAFEAFKKHIKWEAIRNFENPFLYVMGKIMPDPEYELPWKRGAMRLCMWSAAAPARAATEKLRRAMCSLQSPRSGIFLP